MSPTPPRDRVRIGAVSIPALALLPFAAYMALYCAHAVHVRPHIAVAVGALIFVILFLPVARMAVRMLRSHTWDKDMSPKRVYARTVPLYGLVLFFPVANLVTHVERVAGAKASSPWFSLSTWGAVVSLALVCAWPIFTAARALTTQAVAAVDDALLGSAASLLVMGAFTRLSAEADHFHGASRPIGLILHGVALAFAALAVFAAWRRSHWAKSAYRAGGTSWGILGYQPTVHGRVAPLDVSTDASAADGVIVRYTADPGAPYRSREGAVVPFARTWLDEARTLRPLVQRRVLAVALLAVAVLLTPFQATDARQLFDLPAPAFVHIPAEDVRAFQPSGPLGFPSQCTRQDPIYFIPVGRQAGFDIQELANRYTAAYKRHFLVLQHRDLPNETYDRDREQWDGEAILEKLSREEGIIAPKRATLIAVTSDDLYLGSVDWQFAFGTRRPPNMAIVSSARMRQELPGVSDAEQVDAIADYRLRKMITRNLGFLYCNVRNSFKPNSVMFFRNMGQPDLDEMDESVW